MSHFVVLGVLGIVLRFGGIICLGRADVRVIANCTEDVQTVELDSVVLVLCVVRHTCTCHVPCVGLLLLPSSVRSDTPEVIAVRRLTYAWCTCTACLYRRESALHMESIRRC